MICLAYNSIIPEIKARVSIPDAYRVYDIELHRRGNKWFCCCPLPGHSEKTPSHAVFDDGKFYCYGCHRHGDVIDFTRQLFGLSFKDALAKLAADFGIDGSRPMIPARPKKSEATRLREQFFGIVDSLLLDRRYIEYLLRQSVTAGAVLAMGKAEGLTFDLLFGWPEEQAAALLQARRWLDGRHWRNVGEHPAA